MTASLRQSAIISLVSFAAGAMEQHALDDLRIEQTLCTSTEARDAAGVRFGSQPGHRHAETARHRGEGERTGVA